MLPVQDHSVFGDSTGDNCIVLGKWNSSWVMIPSCWEIREMVFLFHGLSRHREGPSFQRLEMLVLCYSNCHLSMTREKKSNYNSLAMESTTVKPIIKRPINLKDDNTKKCKKGNISNYLVYDFLKH